MKRIFTLCTWLLAFSLATSAQVSEQEFQALKALYNATDGDNWFNRTGWENINTTATKDDVTTAWFGISTITGGHITEMAITANNLNGSIPSEIGSLTWLTWLSFYSNNLSGSIPVEFGNLINLTGFNLYQNKLSGELPITMRNLLDVQYVYIGYNIFNCPFPSEIISNWSRLNIFDSPQNGFYGEIDLDFNILLDLYNVNLSQNNLTGNMPSITTNTNLNSLDLSYNQLTGNLPTFENCVNLQNINLSQNEFSGSIPQSWENLINIRSIELQKNNLTGIIPDGIFKPRLNNLLVDRNYFTFEGIEPVITSLKALTSKGYWTDKFFTLNNNTISVNKGEPFNLNAATLSVYNLGGNNNRYKWFRNEEEVYSGNSPVYNVVSAGNTDAGIYRFEVTNTVVTGLTFKSENITVNIIGGNEAPTDIVLSATSVDENYSGTVATLSAVDPDATDVHTFSLASGNGTNDKNNGKFQIIDGNQLKMISSADYETTPSLYVLITVNDGNGGVFTKAVTIAVNNINEIPRYNSQVSSVSIDENAGNSSTVCTLTAQDPEGTAVSYSITSGNDNNAFGIDGNKLVVADNTKLNYDVKNQYSLVVSASDGTLSANATITVSLNKINQMPQVENQVFALDENSPEGTVVGSIVATDREGDPLTYSITAGNAAGAFTLDGKTLKVANSAPLDYETTSQFVLTVSVSDGISNVQVSITINLNNVADNADNDILTFSVPGIVDEASIDPVNHTVAVTVTGVAREALTAEFTISPGAESDPASGTVLDFTNAQIITVSAESGNVQEWTVTVGFRTASRDFAALSLVVYPNPAHNFLFVEGIAPGACLSVINLIGEKVWTKYTGQDQETIDLNGLRPGVYLLQCESQNGRQIQRFVKQ